MGTLSFATPLLLAALLLLPAIWFLLRVTPPAPRREVFPPLPLLQGLQSREETPARTPWWLLLLRLFAAALIIIALAGPRLGKLPEALGRGPLVLFVDNDWAAANTWTLRQAAMRDAIAAAAAHHQPVVIVPTAKGSRQIPSVLTPAHAQRLARELVPEAFLGDRPSALKALLKLHFAVRPQILWLSDDLDYGHARAVARTLRTIGSVELLRDQPTHLPMAITRLADAGPRLRIDIRRTIAAGAQKGRVEATNSSGDNLASAAYVFAPDALSTTATLALPLELRNRIARLGLEGYASAGALHLLSTSARFQKVGIVAATSSQNGSPLLSGAYYLQRALSPYADVSHGTIAAELSHHVNVLVLSDIGRITGADYARVARFVATGGVLIRFAGPRMTHGADALVPVTLRSGGRYLGGAMGWTKPQHLAAFPDSSPFRGLAIPKDVTISRQILAEPSIELASRSWARLDDGTPLVTGAPRGKGWIVLFHVPAAPGWSTLPMSHLFIDMLRRLLQLSAGTTPGAIGAHHESLPPLAILDGFGHLNKPAPETRPLAGKALRDLVPSPNHPPGLYGSQEAMVALNATTARTRLRPLPAMGLTRRYYSGHATRPLAPDLLLAALVLLLSDALIGLWLRGLLPRQRWLGVAALLLLLPAVLPSQARAGESFDMKAALNTRLAYVITGIPSVDKMSKAGLTGLGLWLRARTSYDPKSPMGVNLATDNLSFFPLLYWPMDPREKALTPAELDKIQTYMRDGGTLFIDTRELTLGPTRGPNNPGEVTLKRLLGKLDLPPLEPIPADHVLTKTFYLLSRFPGRWAGGTLWVQKLPPKDPNAGPEPARGGDDVSPIIIGSNDYAAAWAVNSQGEPLVAIVPGGEEQREMAVRVGINIVMYALTGNYKADTVQVPALLRRLGK